VVSEHLALQRRMEVIAVDSGGTIKKKLSDEILTSENVLLSDIPIGSEHRA